MAQLEFATRGMTRPVGAAGQVKETKRSLILIQHGKSSAVLLVAAAYQALIEKLELLREIQIGEKQLADGKYITHEQVKQRLLDRYKK